jgi:hypothetical protein
MRNVFFEGTIYCTLILLDCVGVFDTRSVDLHRVFSQRLTYLSSLSPSQLKRADLHYFSEIDPIFVIPFSGLFSSKSQLEIPWHFTSKNEAQWPIAQSSDKRNLFVLVEGQHRLCQEMVIVFNLIYIVLVC